MKLFFQYLIFLYLVLRSYATVLLHVTYLYLFPKLRNIKERPQNSVSPVLLIPATGMTVDVHASANFCLPEYVSGVKAYT